MLLCVLSPPPTPWVELIDVCMQHRVDQPRPPPTAAPSSSRPPQTRRRRPPAPHRPPPVATDTAILQRRHIYRHHLLSLHVGSNRISRFRSYTPRMVREDEELQFRAKTFIRRELQVFEWTTDNREFILEYILAILKTRDLKSATGAAEDMLTDLLGRQNAQTFCHEIHAFLRSPYKSLGDFDRQVQYTEPLPTRFDEDGMPVGHTGPRKRRAEEGEETPVEPESRRRRRE